jgi:CRISPR system Cascade subunit CasE
MTTALYFSRLLLAPSRDLYAVHQTLWDGFRSGEPTTRPFLFRADRVVFAEQTHVWKVLVQHEVPADWQRLGTKLVEQTQVGPRPLAFRVGERLRFFARLNATVSKKGRGQIKHADLDSAAYRAARGIRVAVRDDEEAHAWLGRQGQQHGFALVAARVAGQRRERWQKQGHAAVLDGVDVEGHLEVTDAAGLTAVIRAGIGRGRSVGFGLLSVARDGDATAERT